jgi:ketosteroid isomerase-like protein
MQNPGRMVEDRVAIRLPRLYRLSASVAWGRLPRRSGVRRKLAIRVAKRSYNALGRGDLAALHGLYHPECRLDFSRYEDFLAASVYHGHEGLRRLVEDLQEGWGESCYELTELRIVGDRVLLGCHQRNRGRHTGMAFERTFSQVAEARDGLVLRVDSYTDRGEALEAVGLSE